MIYSKILLFAADDNILRTTSKRELARVLVLFCFSLNALFFLKMINMCTEDEQYEEYLSWRDDMDSVERYLDRVESQLDDKIERYNQSGIES
jgi:hypothetical protein